jgi:hypothetical protein
LTTDLGQQLYVLLAALNWEVGVRPGVEHHDAAVPQVVKHSGKNL